MTGPDGLVELVLDVFDGDALRERGESLLAGDVIWFPIRHHSPACARHVQQLIVARRPWAVLVEGPPSYDDVIEHLVHPDAQMPLAIYGYAVVDGDAAEEAPRRYSSYFPLCDYSPELVALRAGAMVGSRLGFVDLDHDDLARLGHLDGQHSLVDEHAYAFSEALGRLASELGCRDHNELWDHLIEAADLDLEPLVAAVSAYGALARIGSPTDTAASRRDESREAAMVELVRAWVAARDSNGTTAPIVVVTGAFHTAVLPELLARSPSTSGATPPSVRIIESGHGLVRYSFDRLDALSGYAAGMPSPAWYQELWECTDTSTPASETAHRVLRDVAAVLRNTGGDGQPSTPTLIDAHAHTQLLMRLRGRPTPSRTDVADAALTCFAKGEYGLDVRTVVASRLTGSRVGRLAPETPRPPIANDFDRRAAALRLRIDTSEARRLELAIYRSDRDREVSRFFHGLAALGVVYAHAIQTPRWSAIAGRDVTREIWNCRLSAETDLTLAEASMWGSSVEEAVGARLRHRFDELIESQPTSLELLRLVQTVAQCGVHDAIEPILAAVRVRIGDDPDLTTVVASLVEADLLRSARQPLDGASLASLPAIGEQLYLRACTLVSQLGGVPDDSVGQAVDDLRRLHHVTATADWLSLDPTLLIAALDRLRSTTVRPRLRGAVDAIGWQASRATDDELLVQCTGHLMANESDAGAEYLAGMIGVARETLWTVGGLLDAVSEYIASISDTDFVRRLPGLRSVFAMLAPRETDRVAERLGSVRGVRGATPRVRDLAEQTLLAHVTASVAVAEQLAADGLGAWLGDRQELAGDG